MRKMDKELIDHIKNQLASHEEAYTPGAWERFSVQEEKKRRGIFYWPLWTAAAVILIIGGFFILNQDKVVAPVKVAKVETQQQNQHIQSESNLAQDVTAATSEQEKLSQSVSTSNTFNNGLSLKKVELKDEKNALDNKTPLLASSNLTLEKGIIPEQLQLNEQIYTNRITVAPFNQITDIVQQKKNKPVARTTFEDILAIDSYNNRMAKTHSQKQPAKWEPGIFVAPAMGNDNKVNMNYGFSIAYQVADKLSISSGIAYSALSSTSAPSSSVAMASDAPAASPTAFTAKGASYSTSSKNLESVNASLNGINIPLELKYNISNKFYTGVGVSALAIINNKQNNNYLVSNTQNTTVANTNGLAEQRMMIVTERVSEQQSEASTSADKYIGFYNFSLGYKQKISGKKNFAVEPFLRVPMKTFSNENLNLTNGGIRLKLDF